jgi:hypothetical protein
LKEGRKTPIFKRTYVIEGIAVVQPLLNDLAQWSPIYEKKSKFARLCLKEKIKKEG